jgi:predicted nucleic acid-binding protein
MVAVVDASIFFPLLVNEDKSIVARRVLSETDDVIFLDFLLIEIANSLASSLRRRRFDTDYAIEAMAKAKKLITQPVSAAHYLDDAFTLALAINHPVYDCLYAITARENKGTLVTCDAKFAAKLDPATYGVLVL